MSLLRRTVAFALLTVLALPESRADIPLGTVAGSQISLEGLFQADGNWFNNDFADLNAVGTSGKDRELGVRRSEIVLKGKGPNNFDWVLGYDPSAQRNVVITITPSGTATSTVHRSGRWLDANVKYRIGGSASHFVQVGQFKQPNSLEDLGSTRHNDFISKALATNIFAVGRRLGVGHRIGDRHWGVSTIAYGRELTRDLAHGQGFGVRGTWAPVIGGGRILHFGISYVDFDSDGDTTRLRARPAADFAVVSLVDTGSLTNTDRQATIGGEAMWVTGPFKLQGEYMHSRVDRYDNGNPRQSRDVEVHGGYLSALWNVTGEAWAYKDGVAATPLPEEPDRGMWQLGLRYDAIDLDDGTALPGASPTSPFVVDGVLGGELDTFTLGVNWYWRSNFKVSANYVKVDSSRFFGRTPAFPYAADPANNSVLVNRVVEDNPDILELRVQFSF